MPPSRPTAPRDTDGDIDHLRANWARFCGLRPDATMEEIEAVSVQMGIYIRSQMGEKSADELTEMRREYRSDRERSGKWGRLIWASLASAIALLIGGLLGKFGWKQ